MTSFRSASFGPLLALACSLALAPVACGGDTNTFSAAEDGGGNGDETNGDETGGTSSSDGGSDSGSGGFGAADGGSFSGDGGSATGGNQGSGGSNYVGSGPCYDAPCAGTCEGTCEGGFVCNTSPTVCMRDLATFCGCDGVEFQASSNCPDYAYANHGACESGSSSIAGGLNCSEATTTCDSEPGTCPDGEVREVIAGCWGDCVAVTECGCNGHDDCPDPDNIDEYACINSTKRCDYWK